MVNTFERLFSHLKANRPIDTIRQELSSIPLETPNFISKWVDHGDQYGLGFELLDSTVGIFFRDSTSMVMAPDMYHLEYLYYPPNDENNGIKCEFLLSNSLPSPLHKKQRVLKRYSRYMTDRLSSAVAAPFRASVLPPHLLNPPPYAVPANKAMAQLPYITKFLRTRRASLFRLSSRVVQMNFKSDHIKLIVSGKGHVVTAVSTEGFMETRYLLDILLELKSKSPVQVKSGLSAPLSDDLGESSSPRVAEKSPGDLPRTPVPVETLVEYIEYLRDVMKHILNKKQATIKSTKELQA
ncbi:Cell cycle serine/threonine-protein kinase cdc5/MSD2 [Entomophthora muscae]|uniref:Cell cycle serine/threonine-protein kinase cdc5/MSD2 n=1 Tax=Entomophthora muscae TaxID=34485 RepID=A0ACC2U9X5_9FUNG|nr:Cell cycle serine/threonine-protein kinase cdc5/MSD2 [Entomophthora muscae]